MWQYYKWNRLHGSKVLVVYLKWFCIILYTLKQILPPYVIDTELLKDYCYLVMQKIGSIVESVNAWHFMIVKVFRVNGLVMLK